MSLSGKSVRQYESVVVFNPKLNDSQLKDEIKKFETILTNNSVPKVTVEILGRKELAYIVKKERFGTFVNFKYETENHQAPNTLSSLLRIADSVQKFETHVVGQPKRKVKVNPKRTTTPGSSDDFDDAYDSM